jgi:glucuronokinase
VETEELGLPAGLQDRVIQVYEGLVYMDFAADKMTTLHGFECGAYEPLDPASLPPSYVAYDDKAAEPTEAPHSNLRARYRSGDPLVVEAMTKFADITVQARQALKDRDFAAFGRLIDANFDLRRTIQPISDRQLQMVRTARQTGATAKFAGSGGAIIGTYEDDAMYDRLERQLGAIDCRILKPIVEA